MRKPVRTLALLSVAALAAGMGLSGSANAAQAGDPEILAKNVPAPLSLAVAEDGSAYVTANFAGNAVARPAKGDRRGSSSTSARRTPRSPGCPLTASTVTFTTTGKNKVVRDRRTAARRT